MDAEKERLVQRYKDEHRRLVDRERELVLGVLLLKNRFEELRESGKDVEERYASVKRKTAAFQVWFIDLNAYKECRPFHWRCSLCSK